MKSRSRSWIHVAEVDILDKFNGPNTAQLWYLGALGKPELQATMRAMIAIRSRSFPTWAAELALCLASYGCVPGAIMLDVGRHTGPSPPSCWLHSCFSFHPRFVVN